MFVFPYLSGTYVEKPVKHYYDPFGGYMNFLNSYGLKIHTPEDVEEGKNIIQAFRDRDRYEWEAKQKAKKAAKSK
ncbi:hypothetical protein FIBSPDRAFT_942511 [Athelia psychrophila]|uniref:Uncharacterized protein n=1 Tax=Athelia psychrophila TaxID=1759441 RepID=A0A166X3C5_9AGAM|nr:hypothetical protein FIBSPDRAFT_942511 [Fibularhizoctonia sp. CBS 109695]